MAANHLIRCCSVPLVALILVGCGGTAPAKSKAPEKEKVSARPVASGEAPSTKVASSIKAPEPRKLSVLGGAEIAGQGANPVVLEWDETMTNFSVSAVQLVVRKDRHAHFERVGEQADTQDYVIPEDDWEQVLEQLRKHKVCTLRGSGEFEHEDQMPSLVIAVRGAACKVVLNDQEWAMDPRAIEVARAVATLFPSPLASDV